MTCAHAVASAAFCSGLPFGRGLPFSGGTFMWFVIGRLMTSWSLASPSHAKRKLNGTLNTLGLLVLTGLPATFLSFATFGEAPAPVSFITWQLTHDMEPSFESRLSKKRRWP